jgi:hypothetical protein
MVRKFEQRTLDHKHSSHFPPPISQPLPTPLAPHAQSTHTSPLQLLVCPSREHQHILLRRARRRQSNAPQAHTKNLSRPRHKRANHILCIHREEHWCQRRVYPLVRLRIRQCASIPPYLTLTMLETAEIDLASTRSFLFRVRVLCLCPPIGFCFDKPARHVDAPQIGYCESLRTCCWAFCVFRFAFGSMC